MPMFPLWSHNTWLLLTRPDGLPAATVEKYTQLFTTGDQLPVTSNQEYMLWSILFLVQIFFSFVFGYMVMYDNEFETKEKKI